MRAVNGMTTLAVTFSNYSSTPRLSSSLMLAAAVVAAKVTGRSSPFALPLTAGLVGAGMMAVPALAGAAMTVTWIA